MVARPLIDSRKRFLDRIFPVLLIGKLYILHDLFSLSEVVPVCTTQVMGLAPSIYHLSFHTPFESGPQAAV
jgi:hypothetical protein